jgi:hypothetical protein
MYASMCIYLKSYNRGIHTSIGKSPFENCFGYFPPSPLDVVYGKKGGVGEELKGDALRVDFFLRRLGKSICKYRRC